AVPSFPPDARQAGNNAWIINTGGCETGPAVPKPGNHNIVYSNCKGRFGVFDKRTGTEQAYYVGASNMYGHNPKDLQYRFQRVSPIHVSPHNPDVVYHASQYVHRTTDDGRTWETISPDLTAFEADKQVISGAPITRDITGEEFYSTIYALRESPVQAGIIWAGANDGPVHVTLDNGEHWDDVTPAGLPAGGRVDAVEPSPHSADKAYIAVLRYQLGDWKPYIYQTTNTGKNWRLLSGPDSGFPQDQPVRVVREDPVRPGLLYAGTEFGLHISFDDGDSWQPFQQNLPVTPITDIKIHRNDLVMSTMGRGFWILDDLTPLRSDDFTTVDETPVLFPVANTIRYRQPYVRAGAAQRKAYGDPGVILHYYLPEKEGPIQLNIFDEAGDLVQSFASDSLENSTELVQDMGLNQYEYLINRALVAKAGVHRFVWDMRARGPWDPRPARSYRRGALVLPGTYTLELVVGYQRLRQSFALEMDPRQM
ncbi:MAG: hypothetical protein AAGA62_13860, partial [Bacteroidota bacterium]